MIHMKHHDDGKEKYQSHEISLREESFSFFNEEFCVWSHNPFDITDMVQQKKKP